MLRRWCRWLIAMGMLALPLMLGQPNQLHAQNEEPESTEETVAPQVQEEAESEEDSGASDGSGESAAAQAEEDDALDETALRYYARMRDLERLEAEIRRLRSIDPTWQPPDDLFNPDAGGGFDESPLWNLFAEGRYAEVRESIAELQQTSPGYSPSEELLEQLDLAEAQERLRAAAQAEQWGRVIELSREEPALISCERVDNAWTVAEAFVRMERPNQGAEVYRGILSTCNDESVLLATLQKASELLDDERLIALDALVERRLGQTEEAARVREDLRRGRLAERLSGGEDLAPELLQGLQGEAREGQDAELALTLGWYFAERRSWADANSWFQAAQDWGAGIDAVEGRVLALMRLGRTGDAEALASRHASSSPAIYRSYIGLLTGRLGGDGKPVNLEVAAKLAEYAERNRDASTALALGWAAMELEEPYAAEAWFRQSLNWRESEDAAVGLAVALQQLGDQAGFDALAAEWAGRSSRIAEMLGDGGGGAPSAAATALQRGQIASCLQLTSGPSLSGGDRSVRAWCLLEADRSAEAMATFQQVMAEARDEEAYAQASYGYLLTLLQRGQVDEAMQQMHALPMTAEQKQEVFSQAMANMASAAFDNGDYQQSLRLMEAHQRVAPLPRYLAELQGWAYLNSNQFERARTTFKRLDQQMSTRDTQLGLRLLKERELK
ncbi:hypothetical protein [Aquibaculum arenosum]|uniref:Tetratricopeptide repeat protein n=1 Tax=Aquibaculum arenosum TaxID=3032591 RepID=A0ABT5YQ07_9PROT|nr:hypothetical protein [Fodinicurvata sp. CAU 1616]MDF2096927.1 hypothetical protein [Fodinicurvata sp. CAU 1616]